MVWFLLFTQTRRGNGLPDLARQVVTCDSMYNRTVNIEQLSLLNECRLERRISFLFTQNSEMKGFSLYFSS